MYMLLNVHLFDPLLSAHMLGWEFYGIARTFLPAPTCHMRQGLCAKGSQSCLTQYIAAMINNCSQIQEIQNQISISKNDALLSNKAKHRRG